MSIQALLTDHEVAEALGVTPQHIRANTDSFETEIATETSKNGRNRRMYKLGSLPPDAQIEWARRNNVIAMTPASAPGQLALSLTVPVGPNLSEEDRIEVEKRYRMIEPLIRPDQFVAIWAQHKNSRVAVIDWLAKQHKTKRRIHGWRRGVAADCRLSFQKIVPTRVSPRFSTARLSISSSPRRFRNTAHTAS